MIIDTEAHLMNRAFPLENESEEGWFFRYRWHAHPGPLLKAEMDHAGVDKAIVISYDGFDMEYYMRYKHDGSGPEDYYGGASYCYRAMKRYPERFLWFTTLRDPRRPSGLTYLEQHFSWGALGIKVFPGFLAMGIDDDALLQVYDICRDHGKRVIFGFEDTHPPETPSLAEVHRQLATVAERFPDVNFQVNHLGCVDPRRPEAEAFFASVRPYPNVFVSTACLQTQWNDGSEYPFIDYLSRIQVLKEAVGVEKLMWGSDWPWLDCYFKYTQLLDSVRKHALFLDADEKAAILGGNALRFLGLSEA
jgi:predicted TIM-barrel fold metal-dependent hydrolase